MANELSYNDYKRIEEIHNTRNIIYPIFDVLKKASHKIGVEDVIVDEVIVNSGMSKFYMIIDRLKDFFGFKPIVALDPDQAVARGAAVYHYYLHKYEEMRDDMKLLGNVESIIEENHLNYNSILQNDKRKQSAMPHMAIEWENNILNDCLYLGVKNGAVHEIIPTDAELPYISTIMTGFRVEPGQNRIAIPIKSQNLDGTYRIIAKGNISFEQSYNNGAYVAFKIYMESNKIINMKVWTSKDIDGNDKIEEGYAKISIDNSEKPKVRAKFLAPNGSKLQPTSEINNILQLCQNYEKYNSKNKRSKIAKRIAINIDSICNASNKNEFSKVVLSSLTSVFTSERAKERLFIIARKIGTQWSESEKKNLAAICMSQLNIDFKGFPAVGQKISTNIQAIYTLSICASSAQLSKLAILHYSSKYLQACLYTHAKTRSDLEWLQEQLNADVDKSKNNITNNIQGSSYAIGVALRKEGLSKEILSPDIEGRIVKQLCEVIQVGNLSSEELTCCLLALGWICDQREYTSKLSENIIQEVFDTLRNINHYYSINIAMKQGKVYTIVTKMINGDSLNMDEEKFLLTKLEK